MKFHKVTTEEQNMEILKSDFEEAREIGVLHIGEKNLFYKRGLKTFYLPYKDVTRYFRRVLMVPAQVCCGKGEISVESLVVQGTSGEQICELPLPGTKAARIVMEELGKRMPETPSAAPKKQTEN